MCHKLGLETAMTQAFSHLANLLIDFCSGACSAVNIIHVSICPKGPNRFWVFVSELLPQTVNCNVSLVPRTAHAVPGTLHTIDLRLLIFSQFLAIKEK